MKSRRRKAILICMLAFLCSCGRAAKEETQPVAATQTSVPETETVSAEPVQEEDTSFSDTMPEEAELARQLQGLFSELLFYKEERETNSQTDFPMAGSFILSGIDQYPEEALRQFYGEDYAERLPLIELRADGTGRICEKGDAMPFHYTCDGKSLLLTGDNGGTLLLTCDCGGILLVSPEQTSFLFSKTH